MKSFSDIGGAIFFELLSHYIQRLKFLSVSIILSKMEELVQLAATLVQEVVKRFLGGVWGLVGQGRILFHPQKVVNTHAGAPGSGGLCFQTPVTGSVIDFVSKWGSALYHSFTLRTKRREPIPLPIQCIQNSSF